MAKEQERWDDGDHDDTFDYIKYRQELADNAEVLENKYPHLFNKTRHIDLSQPTSSEEEEEEQVILEQTEYPEISKAYKGTLIKYLVHYQNKQGGKQLTKAVDTIQEAKQYFNNNNYYRLDYN